MTTPEGWGAPARVGAECARHGAGGRIPSLRGGKFGICRSV